MSMSRRKFDCLEYFY